jgi:hydroxymethylglutaryl-CoA reductase (NADPH)
MKIPSLLLKKLYTVGSLANTDGGLSFGLKNRLTDVTVTGLHDVRINEAAIDLGDVHVEVGGGEMVTAAELGRGAGLDFPLRKQLTLHLKGLRLEKGSHQVGVTFAVKKLGKLSFDVTDSIAEKRHKRVRMPYDPANDYSAEIIKKRQDFVAEYSGKELEHVTNYSFDPAVTNGNVEAFTGVAQVPLGFAGPLKVLGEHAQGEFLIPLAAAEGTLVASYNRGCKVINLSGGVKTTVQDDCMQRAPVFAFDSAREARDFRDWVGEHMDGIREAAEATSSVAKLLYIDTYLVSKFAYLRFNYSTGDAAGQNMVGRATFAACSWVLDRVDTVRKFFLESNLATDKKASQVNVMRTRGKRVTAEATVPRSVLVENMRVDPEALAYHYGVGTLGSVISGANNNGLHSANAITAMFIATGQDVANVSESSAGLLYAELTPNRDLYMSITLPSLIVATYGGGVGLPTQRECLETIDCYGRGKVRKLAEIVAGAVLAGEISLACAIASLDWVSSHEQYGRNR